MLATGRPDPENAVVSALAGFDFILFVGEGSAAVPQTPMLQLRAASEAARLFAIRHEPPPAE